MDKKLILVVNDEPSIADNYKDLLEERNYDVLVAYNVTQAEERIRESKAAGRNIDIMVVDERLPETDGYSFTQDISSGKYDLQPIPLLFILSADPSKKPKECPYLDGIVSSQGKDKEGTIDSLEYRLNEIDAPREKEVYGSEYVLVIGGPSRNTDLILHSILLGLSMSMVKVENETALDHASNKNIFSSVIVFPGHQFGDEDKVSARVVTKPHLEYTPIIFLGTGRERN